MLEQNAFAAAAAADDRQGMAAGHFQIDAAQYFLGADTLGESAHL
jgi:hypothetical protein